MSRPKKDPMLPILTRPEHLFEAAYPYLEGAIKEYALLTLYQERVDTRNINPLDPAQIRAHALYFDDLNEASVEYGNALRKHGSRLFYAEILHMKLGINGAFWESVFKTGRVPK